MSENKKYTIVIKRQRVEVSEAVYRAYHKEREAERYQNKLICQNELSLERFREDGVNIDYLLQTQTITPIQKRVDVIPANILLTKPNARKRKLRVAAYCRVSTEQEEQQSSYAAQIAYYTEKINKNKDWELAGIFADEGITGTSAKKRTEFLKLMALRNGKKKVVWRCINRLEYGTKYCKESPTIEESRLHQAIVTALNRLDEDKADVIDTLKAGLQLAIGTQDDDSFNESAVQNRIAELQSVMMHLVELSSKSSAGADYFDAKFEEIATEIKGLQGQLGEHQEQTMLSQNTQARIHELLYTMEHIDLSVKEYRDDVVKGIITKVVVLSEDRIRITFDNNMEMEQELPSE